MEGGLAYANLKNEEYELSVGLILPYLEEVNGKHELRPKTTLD